MDKKQILLDSVKKLLALEGVTENDIIENLKSVGLTQEQAVALIKEAKQGQFEKKPTPKPAEGFKKSRKPSFDNLEKEMVQESMDDTAQEDLTSEEEEFRPIEETPKPSRKPARAAEVIERKQEAVQEAPRAAVQQRQEPRIESRIEPVARSMPAEVYEHVDLNKLWETGVLTTVDAKLEEMRTLRKEIDVLIDNKVSGAVEKETGKIKAFFDAQRDLNNSRMSSLVSEKTEEFSETINAKLSELRQINNSVQDATSRLEAKQQVNSELYTNVNDKLADLEKTKSRLISSMNAELIMSKSKVEAFVQEAQKKLTDLDLRVTRTLELENKIAEGLMKDAENKISAIVDQKTYGIDKKISDKITELNSIQERVDPRKIEERLAILVQDATAQVQESVSRKVAPLALEVEEKINDLSNIQSRVDPRMMESRIMELEKRFQKDADTINQRMEEFNLFKEQFIAVIEKNTQSFNKAIKEFNEDRQKQTVAIDAKIKELENFERKFAEEMGLMVEELYSKDKEKTKAAPSQAAQEKPKPAPSQPAQNAGKKKKN
ncbi:MAG: hypothetical protein Q7R70_02345 [Candidatus Diapherotrites archaeon]|nr:hypothetical protein [Candidatus Diapherotrites archaeon]